ncbi:MAG: crotonase/enoyl-CoA hydratase family protein [Gammaproteobacteria bacterium]
MKAYNLTNEAQLRNFTQIEVEIDPEYGIAWAYQNPSPRQCFNPTMVEELRSLQIMLEVGAGVLPYRGENVSIKYLVLDSRTHGVFSMGGDLDLFRHCIINNDKNRLLKYAKSCIDTIHGFIVGCRSPITTIALVRGDALGGGLEVALSCHHIIAEEQAELGFPEILFNIFPGMGGYPLLCQRLPQKQVEKMMLNGNKYPADEMLEMGVIDQLEETGKGRDAVYSFIKNCNRYRNGYMAMKGVREKVHPISHEDLMEVSKYWVDITMNISDRDIRLMERLVRAQEKQAIKVMQPQDYRQENIA